MTLIIILASWYLIGFLSCIFMYAELGSVSVMDVIMAMVGGVGGLIFFMIYIIPIILNKTKSLDNIILWRRKELGRKKCNTPIN